MEIKFYFSFGMQFHRAEINLHFLMITVIDPCNKLPFQIVPFH